MVDADQAVTALLGALLAHADPQRAMNEKSYQKSELDFLGVTVPAIRQVGKSFIRGNPGLSRDEAWSVFEACWSNPVWELRFVGVFILEAHPQHLCPEDLVRFHELVAEARCWAFNDWFGCHLVGGIVSRNPEALKVMDAWADDEDLWVRRVAMQSLLLALRDGDVTEWPRFVRYAEPRLTATDFWTRKVIGWVCRETSKKNPVPVFEFLMRNRSRASGLTLREGAKYLAPENRSALGLKPN